MRLFLVLIFFAIPIILADSNSEKDECKISSAIAAKEVQLNGQTYCYNAHEHRTKFMYGKHPLPFSCPQSTKQTHGINREVSLHSEDEEQFVSNAFFDLNLVLPLKMDGNRISWHDGSELTFAHKIVEKLKHEKLLQGDGAQSQCVSLHKGHYQLSPHCTLGKRGRPLRSTRLCVYQMNPTKVEFPSQLSETAGKDGEKLDHPTKTDLPQALHHEIHTGQLLHAAEQTSHAREQGDEPNEAAINRQLKEPDESGQSKPGHKEQEDKPMTREESIQLTESNQESKQVPVAEGQQVKVQENLRLVQPVVSDQPLAPDQGQPRKAKPLPEVQMKEEKVDKLDQPLKEVTPHKETKDRLQAQEHTPGKSVHPQTQKTEELLKPEVGGHGEPEKELDFLKDSPLREETGEQLDSDVSQDTEKDGVTDPSSTVQGDDGLFKRSHVKTSSSPNLVATTGFIGIAVWSLVLSNY